MRVDVGLRVGVSRTITSSTSRRGCRAPRRPPPRRSGKFTCTHTHIAVLWRFEVEGAKVKRDTGGGFRRTCMPHKAEARSIQQRMRTTVCLSLGSFFRPLVLSLVMHPLLSCPRLLAAVPRWFPHVPCISQPLAVRCLSLGHQVLRLGAKLQPPA
jgi:hypothetical protein